MGKILFLNELGPAFFWGWAFLFFIYYLYSIGLGGTKRQSVSCLFCFGWVGFGVDILFFGRD
jgi:hypothetical protein